MEQIWCRNDLSSCCVTVYVRGFVYVAYRGFYMMVLFAHCEKSSQVDGGSWRRMDLWAVVVPELQVQKREAVQRTAAGSLY